MADDGFRKSTTPANSRPPSGRGREGALYPAALSQSLFGATGALAWLLKLMLRGFALLVTHVDDEVQMFGTEAQARAFIARRRLQRQLEVGPRSSS